MALTSIVIPVCNARAALERCVSSIRGCTGSATPYEIIVVVNGCEDGADDYCRKEGLTSLALPWPRAGHEALSLGLRLAPGDRLLLLRPEALATPGWLAAMTAELDREEAIGVVRPLWKPLLPPRRRGAVARRRERSPEPEARLAPAVLFTRQVLEALGGPARPETPGDETLLADYAGRAAAAGFATRIAGHMAYDLTTGPQPAAGTRR